MSRSVFQTLFFTLLISISLLSESPAQEASAEDKEQFQRSLRFLGEIYNETFIYQRAGDNLIYSSHARAGMKWQYSRKLSLEVYGIGRVGQDANKDFWNNRSEKGMGMRFRFSYKIFLALYSDWIQGEYLKVPDRYPQPDNKTYHDFRTGLIFWYGKAEWFTSKKFLSFHFKPAMEIYSDISYYQKQRHNIIAYANIKYGVEFLRIWKMSFMGYSVLYLTKDTKKDFWNNKMDIGPGFWLKPLQNIELKFIFEWLYGTYYGIEGVDENPFPKHYWDRRIGVVFWYGW